MQQNGQEQQERSDLQQPAEQTEQEGELNSTPVSTQGEQKTAEQQTADECLEMLQRTQAAFVNYRNRVNQEMVDARLAAQSAQLSQLFPVLDDLRRALESAPEELMTHPWVQGVILVARRLATALEQMGVRQIGTVGEHFDPRRHEAVTTEERTDVPEGTILQVIRPGYALGDRIIRPAQVSVARAPSRTREEPVQ